ncbi:MAG: hypothetical protein QOJ32_1672, partial [Frankiaceae bacterium]|nr:hypothetical protein [Frankiaceae bacterium]
MRLTKHPIMPLTLSCRCGLGCAELQVQSL